jgi:hypothetical protein
MIASLTSTPIVVSAIHRYARASAAAAQSGTSRIAISTLLASNHAARSGRGAPSRRTTPGIAQEMRAQVRASSRAPASATTRGRRIAKLAPPSTRARIPSSSSSRLPTWRIERGGDGVDFFAQAREGERLLRIAVEQRQACIDDRFAREPRRAPSPALLRRLSRADRATAAPIS